MKSRVFVKEKLIARLSPPLPLPPSSPFLSLSFLEDTSWESEELEEFNRPSDSGLQKQSKG